MQPLAWHCYATRSWRCGWRYSAAPGDAEMLEYGDSAGYVKGAQSPVNISWHKGFPQWLAVHSSRMVKNHSARKDNFQSCMSSPVRFSIANPFVWEVDWLAMIWNCQTIVRWTSSTKSWSALPTCRVCSLHLEVVKMTRNMQYTCGGA